MPRLVKLTERDEQIIRLRDEMHVHGRKTILLAAVIGAHLIVRKQELAHGNFEAHCAKHFQFVKRTAERYMRLADQLQQRLAGKSLAVGLLGDGKNDTVSLLNSDAAGLLKMLTQITDGKTLTQLYIDFGILPPRPGKAAKARASGMPNPNDPSDPANARWHADRATDELKGGAAKFVGNQHVTDKQRARVAWIAFDLLIALLPDCELQAVPPVTKKPSTIAGYIAKQLGARQS